MAFAPILIALLLIAGCATTPKWEQQGKTPVQADEDAFACSLDVEANRSNLTDKEREALREKCMVEKGYRRR